MTAALILRVLVSALCAYRLARAVAVDKITRRPRLWLYNTAWPDRTPDDLGEPMHPWDWLYGLASCPYCVGFWISLVVWFGWALTDPIADGVIVTLVAAVAVAGAQSLFTSLDMAATSGT